jgi:hypothetical protein
MSVLVPEPIIMMPPEPEIVLASELPAHAPPADFISTYADYADVFEMPRYVHEWVAAQLIASILNKQGVRIEWGAATYPFDLWVLLLSGSGQGRNTITDVAISVLETADLKGLVQATAWGSKVALEQQIAKCPRGLFMWPEFSVVLKMLSDPKFGGVKEWITDRYDNLRVPDAVIYRETGKKSDTPSIVHYEAPRLNILATSSRDWLINSLEQADATGGFIPRWLLMNVGRSEKLVPKPMRPDQGLIPVLADRLKSIEQLTKNADLTQIEQLYDTWYRLTYEEFKSQPNPELAEPFFNRIRGQLLKLAVIFEVSQSGTLTVRESAFNRAVAAISNARESIFELLPSGMNREGSEVEKMAAFIRGGKEKGVTRTELTTAFQHTKKREREERLATLIDGGRVHVLTEKTNGRSATRYIWYEFVKQQ